MDFTFSILSAFSMTPSIHYNLFYHSDIPPMFQQPVYSINGSILSTPHPLYIDKICPQTHN